MIDSSGGAAEVAATFLHAVAWAEHTRVWEMLSARSRSAVLEVAGRRGMDPLLGARLRESTAGREERDSFLADLLHGIRADLRNVDFDTVRCVCNGDLDAATITIDLVQDVPAELGAALPVGCVELQAEPGGRWSVLRVRGST